ncbi:TetR/AcrR family transcriptional regulator [Kribbella solani]|uniref:TetR/AcrR family transcriptional regulator n=1 Tax=Kribbella solani TaxID=236067 RepID=UPI0029B0C03B|nr:TetR/AcrR family transcriptional regulator [Kribbella solani]MDX2974151.1 TetR/AcrR family transcriptional regulator [Kribbella solani]MDX3003828.1 TetR/AcrR family transcriptional regulator [Kribbella solani]
MGTRDDILDAAAEVLRTQGFARATTKSIAQVAGYSEAALYKHFADKPALLLAVLHERMPQLPGSLKELIGNPGSGTVRGNLTRLARTAIDFYVEGFPILVSLFSSQELLIAHRNRLRELNAGPHKAQEGLIRYLREEQKLGRIRRTADVSSAAALLFGACFQRGFEVSFAGINPSAAEHDAYAAALTKTIYEALKPAAGRPDPRSTPARSERAG